MVSIKFNIVFSSPDSNPNFLYNFGQDNNKRQDNDKNKLYLADDWKYFTRILTQNFTRKLI
jgi:hypothetical protein